MAEVLKYERDVKIDKDALDREWINQPQLAMQYSGAAVKAQAEMDSARERLELVKADLDKRMRQMLTGGDKKPTETVIASAVLLHDECKEASSGYLEAKRTWGILKAAADVICDQRKAALENLVRLFGMGYFSTPTVRSRDGEEGLRKSTRQSIRERLGRGKDGG